MPALSLLLSLSAAATDPSFQAEQYSAQDNYTAYRVNQEGEGYRFAGIQEALEPGAVLHTAEDGEIQYLEWGKQHYCPDNPAHTLTFVPGRWREVEGVSFCDPSGDGMDKRLVFVDGWLYSLHDYEGPESWTLNEIYQPGTLSGVQKMVTTFKYVYGGFNKADYPGKVATYLSTQGPIQAPLAEAWEQEHAAELAEQEALSEAYWAEMRRRGNEALAASFAEDPGVTVVNDTGIRQHVDASGTGADQWLEPGESLETSCKQTIQKVDESGSMVDTWHTRPEDCGGSVGLSEL